MLQPKIVVEGLTLILKNYGAQVHRPRMALSASRLGSPDFWTTCGACPGPNRPRCAHRVYQGESDFTGGRLAAGETSFTSQGFGPQARGNATPIQITDISLPGGGNHGLW